MTSFRVRSCSSLLCLLHIVLTRGTGQGTSRSATAPHQGGQQTVVVSGATASQGPRAGSSASPFLEKKVACLLLTSFSHSAAFLRQNGLYQLTRTWWTLYVIRWSTRDAAILSPGTCIFLEKVYLIFLHFSCIGFFSIFYTPDFSPFFMEKNPV